jgi:hypothetical protein
MLKKVIISGLLAAMMSMSVTFANAGIIVFGKNGSSTNSATAPNSGSTGDPCSDSSATAATGIIVFGLTGIIVFGSVEQPSTCGIIVFG